MSDKSKQKRWEVTFLILFVLGLLGYGGVMVMNRREMYDLPFPYQWKIVLLVYMLTVLALLFIALRLSPKKEEEKKKDYSEMTDAELFAINKAAMEKIMAGETDKAHSRDAPRSVFGRIFRKSPPE